MPTRPLTCLTVLALALPILAEPPTPTLQPLVRSIDLNLGESRELELCDGSKATVKLLELKETCDDLRQAVRDARVRVEVNGREGWLTCSTYRLPQELGGVRIDCPVTRGFTANSSSDAWGLRSDARLRLWPARSPLVRPDTFRYPVRQRWFASSTQMANEPCYVNACDDPKVRRIYYHYGLDFGGCEALTEVVAATDGLVVSVGPARLDGHEGTPVKPRYDVVYILDARGWYYRYSHFFAIDASNKPGMTIKAGARLGLLGKEGGSGGWTHLHFDIFCRQPSGLWGCQEAYAFAWEAYLREQKPGLIAVARPHHLIWTGETVTLDGSRSWSAEGGIVSYEWTFCDGTKASGATVRRTYDKSGYYSEVLKVTDSAGHSEYDFAIVHVHDRDKAKPFPPAIHATWHPTQGLHAGDEITFKVRTFATTDGEETWDFGDNSPPQQSKSDGNVKQLAKDGYAVLKHRYAKPGQYLVRVRRTDRHGQTATGHVCVQVE